MKNIIIFSIYFVIYSVLLLVKYLSAQYEVSSLTVLDGYLMINILMGIFLIPIGLIHEQLKDSNFFLNMGLFSKFFRGLFLIASTIMIILILKLYHPFDVVIAIPLWLYLYFSIAIKE